MKYLLTLEPYHDNSTPLKVFDDLSIAKAEALKVTNENGDATIWEIGADGSLEEVVSTHFGTKHCGHPEGAHLLEDGE